MILVLQKRAITTPFESSLSGIIFVRLRASIVIDIIIEMI
jgi:hypothetical protein